MKNGYDQFFKSARQAAKPEKGVRLKLDISNEELLERELRSRAGIKPVRRTKKKATVPWKLVGVSFIGMVVALLGFQNYEKVESFVKNVEISVLGSAHAEDKPKKAAATDKKTDDKKKDEKKVDASEGEAKAETAGSVDLDHLQKLTERKKELDAREEELNRVEQELQAQKLELDKRMKELEQTRVSISKMLEDRVKVDADKIDTLVQMYSNMKAPQAAKIFESMDEDLAVEILGKMKKKNAADIMNLLKAEKAQVFSEKFAGYKRKS